jgi:hypothetical protein
MALTGRKQLYLLTLIRVLSMNVLIFFRVHQRNYRFYSLVNDACQHILRMILPCFRLNSSMLIGHDEMLIKKEKESISIG